MKLTIPLIPEVTVNLPKESVIVRAEMTADILRLCFDVPPGSITPDGKPARGVKTEPHALRIFLAGEKKKYKIEGGPDDGKEIAVEIPIPDESPTLRKLGVFKTKETPATWHVFLVIKS